MKRFYCSPDKKICGVCAGIADYFNIDPTIVRIIVAEIAFFTAIIPAFLVYIVVALIVPKAPDDYYQLYNNTAPKITKGSDKKIAGVCSGIAERVNIDPTLVRLLFVLLFLLVGNGLYSYIVCAVVFPNKPEIQPEFNTGYQQNNPPYENQNPDSFEQNQE